MAFYVIIGEQRSLKEQRVLVLSMENVPNLKS